MIGLARTPLVCLAVAAMVTPLSTLSYVPTGTVLTIEGLTDGPDEPTTSWNQIMTGPICQQATTCTAVEYPSWDGVQGLQPGADALTAALAQTDGDTVVFAYSVGAAVAVLWLAENRFNPDAPDPNDVSFLLVGDLFRMHGGNLGFLTRLLPESQYQVTDVTRQYDWLSDFPPNPFNLVALANAAAGYFTVHVQYHDIDLVNPANNPGAVTWTEGNTTYVFVPTENLPLLEPLRDAGMGELADRLNAPLKVIVEAGYDRELPETDGDPTGLAGYSLNNIPTNLLYAIGDAPVNEFRALLDLANVWHSSDPTDAAKRAALVNVLLPFPAVSEPLGEQLNSYVSTKQFDALTPALAAFDSLTAPLSSGATADHRGVGKDIAAPFDRLVDSVADGGLKKAVTPLDQDDPGEESPVQAGPVQAVPVQAATGDAATGTGKHRSGEPVRALIERVTHPALGAGRDDDDDDKTSRRPLSTLTSVRDRISSSIASRTSTSAAIGKKRTSSTPSTRLRVPKTEQQ